MKNVVQVVRYQDNTGHKTATVESPSALSKSQLAKKLRLPKGARIVSVAQQ